MIRTFSEYLNTKKREAVKQLQILKQVLESGGLKVESFLEQKFSDPYIYCFNPNKDTTFKGVRIYQIGDKIAYRVQRESKTHPYGTAYIIDVDSIFNELMGSGVTKKEHLGKKVIKEVIDTLNAFFKESARVEKEADKWDDEDSIGSVHVRNPLGGDYSSMVQDTHH